VLCRLRIAVSPEALHQTKFRDHSRLCSSTPRNPGALARLEVVLAASVGRFSEVDSLNRESEARVWPKPCRRFAGSISNHCCRFMEGDLGPSHPGERRALARAAGPLFRPRCAGNSLGRAHNGGRAPSSLTVRSADLDCWRPLGHRRGLGMWWTR